MEAVGLYDFDATEGDELSFRQGDILKVCKRLIVNHNESTFLVRSLHTA